MEIATRRDDRQAVAEAAARLLEQAHEFSVEAAQMLYAAGWSRADVDLFLIGARDG